MFINGPLMLIKKLLKFLFKLHLLVAHNPQECSYVLGVVKERHYRHQHELYYNIILRIHCTYTM